MTGPGGASDNRKKSGRGDRLAAALRRNLARRKEAARRPAAAAEPAGDDGKTADVPGKSPPDPDRR